MINSFKKLIPSILIGLVIGLIIRNGCSAKPDAISSNEPSSPSPVEPVALPDCLKSLPNVPVREDEDSTSKTVEAEGDAFEAEGRGQEALNRYGEARLMYSGELGYATGRAMRGDPSASMELNTSVDSPEFPFKVGRAFAKTGKHEIAIACFTESLNKKIASPNDASAYLNRGEAHLAIGQKEKARLDYQKSVELFQTYKLPQYEKMATEKLRSVTP